MREMLRQTLTHVPSPRQRERKTMGDNSGPLDQTAMIGLNIKSYISFLRLNYVLSLLQFFFC